MIEKAKFTYSPLGKALEKQTKAIKNQVEKQIKAAEGHGKQLGKSNGFVEKDSLSRSKQKEIFYNLIAEGTNTIDKLHNGTDFNNLTYSHKGSTADVNCNNFVDAITFFDEIKSSGMQLDYAQKKPKKQKNKKTKTNGF